MTYVYAESEAKNFEAMQTMADKHGVQVKRWPDSFLKTYEQAWRDVVKEESAQDPLFKKVADSYFAFRDKYRIWGDAQKMESTYLK